MKVIRRTILAFKPRRRNSNRPLWFR